MQIHSNRETPGQGSDLQRKTHFSRLEANWALAGQCEQAPDMGRKLQAPGPCWESTMYSMVKEGGNFMADMQSLG